MRKVKEQTTYQLTDIQILKEEISSFLVTK